MTTAPTVKAAPFSGTVRYSETALSGIYEISKIVTSPSSLKVMLNNVVSVMSSFLDMRLAMAVLLDKDGDPEVKVSASTELNANGDDGLPIAVIDQIVATAAPLVVQNCALHPLFSSWKRLLSLAQARPDLHWRPDPRRHRRCRHACNRARLGREHGCAHRPRCALPDHGR